MKVGVQLPEVEYEATWPQIREMARVAEAVGLDSLWVGDHLLYDFPDGRAAPWECWSILAAIAAITERVEIGPLVAALPFHNPAVLAKKAATVDEISGGRLILGVGAGWNRFEFEAFGLPFQRRVDRFAEAFTIVRTLLREGTVDFNGEFYTLRDCQLLPPPRPGGPPLMVGSSRPRMLGLTLPHVQMWNAWFQDYDNDPRQAPELLARIDEACKAAGRSPAEVEKTLALYVTFPPSWGRRSGGVAIDGTSGELAEALGRLGAAGVSHVQAVLDPIEPSSIEKLGGVVQLLR
jgi:alkanesulfonate monooxygenase SsuD/methylene tetrahydromethanopterin reductase-like flavin-dependent oxidoreductase (luciferase family)